MDVLSDVLLAVRLTGAVFYDITARSPFVAASPPTEAIAAKIDAEAEHLIGFHVIASGSCWVETADDPESSVKLDAGEIVIFPTGDANVLASAPGMRGQPDLPLYYRPLSEALPFVIDINEDSDANSCRIVWATSHATPVPSTHCWSRCLGWCTRPFRPPAGGG